MARRRKDGAVIHDSEDKPGKGRMKSATVSFLISKQKWLNWGFVLLKVCLDLPFFFVISPEVIV